MLDGSRQHYLKRVKWSSGHPRRGQQVAKPVRSLIALECRKYERSSGAVQDVHWQMHSFSSDESNASVPDESTDDRLRKWLSTPEHYKPFTVPPDAGSITGGIRLVLCDRPNMTPGMTISQLEFRLIESAFRLHPATLAVFSSLNGVETSFLTRDEQSGRVQELQVVVKACQKVEIANYMLSMCYDLDSGWTTAFICGDGIINPRPSDDIYGVQLHQLKDTILSNSLLWDNPLLLPTILLYNYSFRVNLRDMETDRPLIQIEKTLGVTYAGGSRPTKDFEHWPQGIDPETTTLQLHSISTQIIFMQAVCRWVQRYNEFLLGLLRDLEEHEAFRQHRAGLDELEGIVIFNRSWVEGIDSHFKSFEQRANLQANLLFSIVGQQANLLNREEASLNTRIAKFAKQDSTSMTTFTFITALFLPASFLATFMDMSMFDWTADQSQTTGMTTNRIVSSKFWIYWAIAIPLTLSTMGGWFLQIRRANKKFKTMTGTSIEDGAADSDRSTRDVLNGLPIQPRWRTLR